MPPSPCSPDLLTIPGWCHHFSCYPGDCVSRGDCGRFWPATVALVAHKQACGAAAVQKERCSTFWCLISYLNYENKCVIYFWIICKQPAFLLWILREKSSTQKGRVSHTWHYSEEGQIQQRYCWHGPFQSCTRECDGSSSRWSHVWMSASHPPVSVLQGETHCTCGSSWWSCCRTDRSAPATSNGPIRTWGSSSWWTPKQSPDSGANTRTSRIWIMRRWAERSGKTTKRGLRRF